MSGHWLGSPGIPQFKMSAKYVHPSEDSVLDAVTALHPGVGLKPIKALQPS